MVFWLLAKNEAKVIRELILQIRRKILMASNVTIQNSGRSGMIYKCFYNTNIDVAFVEHDCILCFDEIFIKQNMNL